MSDGAECICNPSTSKMGDESPEAHETVSLVNVTIKKERERPCFKQDGKGGLTRRLSSDLYKQSVCVCLSINPHGEIGIRSRDLQHEGPIGNGRQSR